MLVNKSIGLKGIMSFSGHHLIWLYGWMMIVASTFYYTRCQWLAVPWLPLSLIGTAVAFYVGFKNNQAYDRLWEARKVWGGIVNGSRSWASMIRSFILVKASGKPDVQDKVKNIVFRHIAWIYTLRSQLLVPTQWEHQSIGFAQIGRYNQRRSKKLGVGLFDDDISEDILQKYLSREEYVHVLKMSNSAVHIMDSQSHAIAELYRDGYLDSYQQVELQRLINEFYDNQGKVERIKKFPLPRQYGSMSFIFVCIFIFLLPFGIVSEFAKLGDWGMWASVPFGMIVGWVYINMELIGDYSENPFEGLFNDVPMLAICRNIEIDLLEMMGDNNMPPAITPKNGVLM